MSTALRGPFLRSYYRQVQEVWDWERASGLDWTDLKKESIRIKLLSLAKRGKGPLVGECGYIPSPSQFVISYSH